MRKQGLIEPVQKWHAKTQTLNLNGRILAKLRTKDLSFDRWSIGWGFATAEAEELLAVAVKPADSDSLAIHHALCRDLPNEYSCVYGNLLVNPAKFLAWTFDRLSFSLDWDSEKFQHVARIVGLNDVTGIGPGPKDALESYNFECKSCQTDRSAKKSNAIRTTKL